MNYQKIYVPVDNSAHSNRAIDQALALGTSFDSKLVGCHVYAARMHDYRFKQMEYTLPEEYLVETELARQRKIHDSLITMGLELISDCYLERIDTLSREAGLECERRMIDGKHSTEILRDLAEADDVDLVVLGAVGIGRTKDSQVGSVCARVARETTKDTWVVKHVPEPQGDGAEAERDTVMVAVDGSPESFGALQLGLELARRFGKRLELVSVYDPYLHYAAFRGIAEVLTDKAAKVFRFEEQNQLHEEIIDTGLAEIYQSHLNVAATMAREEGAEPEKTLLDGKAYQKILDHARKVEPWVLVLGRVGVHAAGEEDELGSNAENLLRLAPCDLLFTNRRVVPELDLQASESIHWTPEAEERMVRVPEQVKGIARTAILRLAIEKGHSVVSSDLVTEAMERFMPKGTARATERLAEAIAFDKARREEVSICKGCGIAARVPDPQRCTVCGGTDFERVDPGVIDEIAAGEGGTTEERTYDGRKLAWSQDARKALRAIPDRYQRRRAKARIEKAAHGQRLETITFEMARRGAEVTALDVEERYLQQARWASEQYDLAGRVAFRQMQVYDLARLDETYEIVLFLGVFYHLRYPLLALDLVTEKTERFLAFQTLTMPGEVSVPDTTDRSIDDREALSSPGWPKMAFIEHRLAGDPTNWWAPNSAGVEAMLRSSGLQMVARPAHEMYV
ncbi:MAG: universal stress protein, partial [Acidobacteriota bacterium]